MRSRPPRPPGQGHDQRPAHRAPAAPAAPSALATRYGIDPFVLFCAYHLGITAEDGYQFQNVHQVARRFGTSAGVIKQLLQEFGMDTDAIVHSDFDLAGAQVDVMQVPEGVSRTEVARTHYDMFRTAPRGRRDWVRELANDARENEKIYGRRTRS